MNTNGSGDPVRILLVGAGLIGRVHAARLAADPACRLVGVVDPAEAAAGVATEHGAPHFADLERAIADTRPEGVILATPNQLHEEGALVVLGHRLPLLVEKPVAGDLAAARRMIAAAREAGAPVLVGHHRRHGSIVRGAQEIVARGDIGAPVAVSGLTLFLKPDDYFDVAWRRRAGAGPILINLVHDVDLIRAIVGEITQVQAMTSNVRRGFEVEDTAAVLARFAGGALGAFLLSDTAAAPWSWEMTSGEAPVYPRQSEHCFHIAGTKGALSLPDLTLWRYGAKTGWWEPLERSSLAPDPVDPLVEQVAHFRRVIRDGETPRCSLLDGARTLAAIEAIARAARDGGVVEVEAVD